MVLQNFRTAGNKYFADLFNEQTGESIPVTIQRGGGACDWVAIGTEKPNKMWEIRSVGANKSNIGDWRDGDIVLLGNAIR